MKVRLAEDLRRVLDCPAHSSQRDLYSGAGIYAMQASFMLKPLNLLTSKRLAALLRKAPGVKLLDKGPRLVVYLHHPLSEATGEVDCGLALVSPASGI